MHLPNLLQSALGCPPSSQQDDALKYGLSGPVCKRFHYQHDDAFREVGTPISRMFRVASEKAYNNSRDDSEDNGGHER